MKFHTASSEFSTVVDERMCRTPGG
jgi:hypothetical protein